MKSIKLSLLVLLGTMLITCQKGILSDNIDLTGDWEWKSEDFDCPCYMIYLKRDTTCHLTGGPPEKFKIIAQNDSLWLERTDGITVVFQNIHSLDRGYKKGEKLMFMRNWIIDAWSTPPRYASTEATIVNENLINFKIYYYDDVTKTGTYGLIRYSGVQDENWVRIKNK